MASTGILRDNRYMDHVADHYHPESNQRLEVIYKMLEEEDMRGKFAEIKPRPATSEELELIHTTRYIQLVASTAARRYTMLDPDTYACSKSYETARLAAGGTLEVVDKVMGGEVENAFALIRPPGHHAEADRAMGFCLFNNVAIAAAYALKKYRLKKAVIIDWDLHHGNGTQHSFYDRADVLYFSTHQFPYYPGTGNFSEIGNGPGRGFTVNVPLNAGPGDEEFQKIFEEILKPIVLEYRPDIVFVSAGFDIYYQDPLGGMQVTPRGFANLTRIIREMSRQVCQNRLIFVLEGGYHLEGLHDSVREVLRALRGDEQEDGDQRKSQDLDQGIGLVIKKVRELHRVFWKSL